jgi:hypothetical protein
MKQFDQRKGQVRAEHRVESVGDAFPIGEGCLRQLLEEVEVEAEAERFGGLASATTGWPGNSGE